MERALSLAAERAKQAAAFEEQARKGKSLAGARAKQIAELETRVSMAAERAKQVLLVWCRGGQLLC